MGAYFTIWSMSRMGCSPGSGGHTEITEAGREAAYKANLEAEEKKKQAEYEKNIEKHTYEGDLIITTPIVVSIYGSNERNWDPSLVEDFVMSHTKNFAPEVIDVKQENYDKLYIFVQLKLNNVSFTWLDTHSGEIMLTNSTVSAVKNKINDIISNVHKSIREIGKVSDEIAYMPDSATIRQAISKVYDEKAVFALNEHGGPSEKYPMLAQYTYKGKFGNEKEYVFIVTNVENYH